MAMMDTESSHNPNTTSRVGAAGLMQIMPSTGRGMGVSANKLYDPQTNILYGTQYYRQMLNQFKDPALALAAYNAGPGRVAAAIKSNQAKGLPTDVGSLNLPRETRDYVQRVISRYQQAQAAYGNSPTGNPALDVQVGNANVIAQNVAPVHEKWAKILGIGGKDDNGNPVYLTEAQAKTQAELAGSMLNATVALTRMVQARDAKIKGIYYGKAVAAIAEPLQNRVGLGRSKAIWMAQQIAAELAGHDSLTDLATMQNLGGYVAPPPADPNAEPPTSKAKPPARQNATAPSQYAPPKPGTTTAGTIVNPANINGFRIGVPVPATQDGVDQNKIKGAM